MGRIDRLLQNHRLSPAQLGELVDIFGLPLVEEWLEEDEEGALNTLKAFKSDDAYMSEDEAFAKLMAAEREEYGYSKPADSGDLDKQYGYPPNLDKWKALLERLAGLKGRMEKPYRMEVESIIQDAKKLLGIEAAKKSLDSRWESLARGFDTLHPDWR